MPRDKNLPLSVIVLWLSLSTALLAQDNAHHYSSGTVVEYHHVATDTPPSTTISPENFRRHLEYLRDNNFHVMPLNTMIEALRNGEIIPDRAIAITFDDGYISIYETAFPMLQEFNMPFTLFLSTGPIDQGLSGYMKWEQIKEMADAGVLIANHMVTHPYMLEREQSESESAWLNELRTELLEAEAVIEQHTGHSHRYLAYPYGEFNLAIKQMLAEEGFTGFAQNSGAIGPNSDYLALPRFPLASIYANLDTAKIKFDALAFNASIVEPLSPVTSEANPPVTLRFNPGPYNNSQIGCFANSQPMKMEWLDRSSGLVEISTNQQFNSRRWRYICTAPAPGTNRYYWYSVQWINPDRGE